MTADDSLDDLSRDVTAFADVREWSQFHDPKSLVMALSSEVGELSGVLRWVAGDEADAFAKSEAGRAQLADEIGDVGILLLLLCARTGIGLADAIRSKLARNEVRYPVQLSRGMPERPVTDPPPTEP